MKTDPKLYLAIDNCFAYKRYTRPIDWMHVIKDMGVNFVEASADTECDPLYMGEEYTRDWIREVNACSEKTGVRVKNVYSGHGTYSTLGLTHTDPRVRRRFLDCWMKAQARTAAGVHAGFGFFAHGIDESMLQDNAAYHAILDDLYGSLAELASYCRDLHMNYLGLEQMYTPHMPPWTLDGARTLMREVLARSGGAPIYITVDLGHMNGQQFFQKPTSDYISEKIALRKSGAPAKRVWMGSRKAMGFYLDACAGKISEADAIQAILKDVEKNPHLFAKPEDGDVLQWVREFACYSPIMHLQQSDGQSSPHWPFSPEYNAKGIIDGAAVMQSIIESYDQPDLPGMPPKCDEITLTLEPFVGTAGSIFDACEEIAVSVDYWRQFVPRDGMRLSELPHLR